MSKLTPRQQMLNVEIDRLQRDSPLKAWNEYVEEIQIPADLYPALATGRPELLALIQPRALSAEEAGKVFHLISVLIRTNQALQDHTSMVARLVDAWMDQFVGMRGVAQQIDHFANFRKFGED